ncbi:hypothetical protein B0J11DRAFT_543750 [Dendryphion nanum]|uniref:Uncharacterized protein n=1 Tax=Dendryphion nanum TaxID=256645 RepID=A0A9P9D271_9PLEO|nr:hypothetical protein B0J11DRAFT_545679 [Dendryphion nanum]KAH7111086.1 hypothetical protein B0J11DRAFT_543750 [Dendryphion nanum]
MKLDSIFVVTFLNAVAFAAPSYSPRITISVTNDLTGRNAVTTIPANGRFQNISSLFKNSAIDEHGRILASSAQLVGFVENVFCSFNNKDIVIPLNSAATFAVLGRDLESASLVPTLLNNFQLQCQV